MFLRYACNHVHFNTEYGSKVNECVSSKFAINGYGIFIPFYTTYLCIFCVRIAVCHTIVHPVEYSP